MTHPCYRRQCPRIIFYAAMEEDKEEAGSYAVEGSWRPRCSYPNREWIYRCVYCRARRSVAVSHWGRSGLIQWLSMGRYFVQDATRVCKQCQKAAGLHRCVRDRLIIGYIPMRWCGRSISIAVGTSVIYGIRAVPCAGSPGSTYSKKWSP